MLYDMQVFSAGRLFSSNDYQKSLGWEAYREQPKPCWRAWISSAPRCPTAPAAPRGAGAGSPAYGCSAALAVLSHASIAYVRNGTNHTALQEAGKVTFLILKLPSRNGKIKIKIVWTGWLDSSERDGSWMPSVEITQVQGIINWSRLFQLPM